MITIVNAIKSGELTYTDELKNFFIEKTRLGEWSDPDMMFHLPNAKELVKLHLECGRPFWDGTTALRDMLLMPNADELLKLWVSKGIFMTKGIRKAIINSPAKNELFWILTNKQNTRRYFVDTENVCFVWEIVKQPDSMDLIKRLFEEDDDAYADSLIFGNLLTHSGITMLHSEEEQLQVIKLNMERENLFHMCPVCENLLLRHYPDMLERYIAHYTLSEDAEALFFVDTENFSDTLREKYISSYPHNQLAPATRKILLNRLDAKKWVDFLGRKNASCHKEFRWEYYVSRLKKFFCT